MLSAEMKSDISLVNLAIKEYIDGQGAGCDPLLSGLVSAEEYSLMAGGKRIRPLLALWFSRLFGGDDRAVMPSAIALEMIHTASLIHDDLPCIDNDELRRGKPTSHVVFGESTALLAADGLFMDAFSVISENRLLPTDRRIASVRALARATGTRGLVGGEYVDILGEKRRLELEQLKLMHSMKTGALIVAAAELGAIAAGVTESDERMRDVRTYAAGIGLAFQIIDDVLDVSGSAEELGKNPGSDLRDGKSTYVSFYSCDEARRIAADLTADAISAIGKYPGADSLVALANYLTERNI